MNNTTTMKKEFIVLRSPANTGKTTSIRIAYNNAITHYKLPTSPEIGGDLKDTLDINGRKVCFCSAGDNRSEVQANIDYFNNNNGDILVTACRTKGGTINLLKEEAQNSDVNISFIDYVSNTSDEDANVNKASIILDRIKQI